MYYNFCSLAAACTRCRFFAVCECLVFGVVGMFGCVDGTASRQNHLLQIEFSDCTNKICGARTRALCVCFHL